LEVADVSDVIEVYNQQLSILMPSANKFARELADEVNGSRLASSDLHLYGFLEGLMGVLRGLIRQTVTTLPEMNKEKEIDFKDPEKIISSLRNGIQRVLNDPGRFEKRARKHRSPIDLLQLGHLTIAQIRKLYKRPFPHSRQ
jgi:hypothetical protein